MENEGREFKAAAVRADVPLYKLAAEANINTSRLSRLLNGREALTDRDAGRIRAALERLASESAMPAAGA